MKGLRAWTRDAGLPARAGDLSLAPLTTGEVAELARSELLLPGAPDVETVEWTYARWKPGTSLSAGYELVLSDGDRRLLHVKRYASDKARQLVGRETAGLRGWSDARLRAGFSRPDEGLVLTVFPADRVLPGLSRALDLRRMARFATAEGFLQGARMRAHRSSLTLLRYRPEARAVFCLEAGAKLEDATHRTMRVAVRVLPPATAAGVVAARRGLGSSAGVPSLLAAQPRTGILVEEWLEVESFSRFAFDHAREAGAALAGLHSASQPPAVEPEGGAREGGWADLSALFAWHPELAELSRGLEPVKPEGALVWSHGDFHPDQVAVEGGTGRMRILDLDRLAPAPAATDLGSWLADQLAVQPGADLERCAAPLLEGYASAGGCVPALDALAAATAGDLVSRAAACVRRLEVGAAARAARLLLQARRLQRRRRTDRIGTR